MVICQKDPSKGNAVDNYRPILCLPLMWKLMTRTIAERIYNFLDVNDKLPVDKKDVGKKVEGPKINYELIRPYCVTTGRDIQIWGWYELIMRRVMIWFPIPGYWKPLNLCKCLTTSSNLYKDQ